MRKNNLSDKGLSLSQAQSLSNVLTQKNKEISATLSTINNYSSEISYEARILKSQEGHPIPGNIVDLLKEKGLNAAVIAFLMVNIKAKTDELHELKSNHFNFDEQMKLEKSIKNEVNEEWGWCQLSAKELNEFYFHEAVASHYGLFIHKDGILDKLRSDLPKTQLITWFALTKDSKIPIENKVHHTSNELLVIHEEIATLHRKSEQRVNYFKAKVKNLVTNENARIHADNAIIQNENNTIKTEWYGRRDAALSIFEKDRQTDIKTLSAKRIEVDPIFKEKIDSLLKDNNEEDSEK